MAPTAVAIGTMKVEGFIAARMRMAAMATTARPPINLSINLPLWACLDVRTPAILPSRQLERGLCRELRVCDLGHPPHSVSTNIFTSLVCRCRSQTRIPTVQR